MDQILWLEVLLELISDALFLLLPSRRTVLAVRRGCNRAIDGTSDAMWCFQKQPTVVRLQKGKKKKRTSNACFHSGAGTPDPTALAKPLI